MTSLWRPNNKFEESFFLFKFYTVSGAEALVVSLA